MSERHKLTADNLAKREVEQYRRGWRAARKLVGLPEEHPDGTDYLDRLGALLAAEAASVEYREAMARLADAVQYKGYSDIADALSHALEVLDRLK